MSCFANQRLKTQHPQKNYLGKNTKIKHAKQIVNMNIEIETIAANKMNKTN
jgi:hypothetical protein